MGEAGILTALFDILGIAKILIHKSNNFFDVSIL
jgi:hypothetical protein